MKGPALDLALLVLPPLALGVLVTAHLALVLRLVRLEPRWHAAVALFVPPFAFVWGRRERLYGWSRLWLGAVIVYALSLTAALLS